MWLAVPNIIDAHNHKKELSVRG